MIAFDNETGFWPLFAEKKYVAPLSTPLANPKFALAPTSLNDTPPPSPPIKKAISLAIKLNLFLRRQMAVPIEIKRAGIARARAAYRWSHERAAAPQRGSYLSKR